MSGATDEASRIVSAAEQRGIVLRLMGGLVVRIHCKEYLHLHDAMKRELGDLDFITYRTHVGQLNPFFRSMNYVPDELFLAYFGHKQQKYYNQIDRSTVDVFIDRIQMCHSISFDGRLELDSPTITLADFFLAKMQIVELNEKDIKDIIVILREHDVGENDKETVNVKHVAQILSNDWGFYYTVTSNLTKIGNALLRIEVLSDEDRFDVSAKIQNVLKNIEETPKTTRWKMRAKIGSKKKWYTEVEEYVR